MIRKTLSYLIVPTIATATLLVATGPALAQRGGHGGGGGHAGGYHGGGYGGVNHAGYGGYHPSYYHSGSYGYHPSSSYGYHNYGSYGYRPYSYGYRAYPSYGYSYYPYSYGGWTYPSYGYSYYPDSAVGSSVPSTFDGVSDLGAAASGPAATTANSLTTNTPATPAGDNSSLITVASGMATGSTAHITVRLPDSAELWFNDTKMTANGSVREFDTPALTSGQKYTFDVRARWTDNGITVDQKRTIVFAPGDKVDMSFSAPAGAEKAKEKSP